MMPGLQQSWPEGIFYGFDDIYDGERSTTRGRRSAGGRFPISSSRHASTPLEVEPASRKPLFVFFPTTGTHTPFTPTAPYQPDWRRMLTDHPYEPSDVERSWSQEPDWMDLGPSYVQALALPIPGSAACSASAPIAISS